jgi:drug/metabolite transporter (DMT)-like permease
VSFGSLVGFTCYVWLLRVCSPAKVSTYAFVNPIVAVFLGWWLAGEAITPRVLVSSAVIVAAVATITLMEDRSVVRHDG